MSEDHIRASDAEREQIAARLRIALEEGRLSVFEFDDRLRQLYTLRTRGELVPLLSDLPVHTTQPEFPARQAVRVPKWVIIMWMPWVAVNLMCLTIWLATGAGYFWPFWVAVPWGCALLIPSAIGVLTNDDDDKDDEDKDDDEPVRRSIEK